MAVGAKLKRISCGAVETGVSVAFRRIRIPPRVERWRFLGDSHARIFSGEGRRHWLLIAT
jgi:hypothetical protein